MDFITGFPRTIKQHNEIMVVVDKLRKATHFIPIKYTFKAIDDANFFHERSFWVAWYAHDYYFRQRCEIHIAFLERLICRLRNENRIQHNLASSNRWED
jgi:hypothetical protein